MTVLDARAVTEADVYKSGRLAGRLERGRDAVAFTYDAEYLADEGAPAVATTLPKTTAAYRSNAAGAVLPFFAGLLPEGRRLSALRRAVKTSADDEFSLLVAVGTDTIGDVQVVPRGRLPSDMPSELDVSDWGEVSFAALYSRMTGESLSFEPSGLSGIQVKASARMVALPVAASARRHILKLQPPEYPYLVENEAFFLDLARRSGVPAAPATVVHDRDGRSGLLVERFDRVSVDGTVRAVAQEDACQVLGRYPADKYNLSTTEVVTALAAATGAPVVAARELLRQFAFAYLTGNGDAHAKNFSVFHPGDEWRVTPAYDTASTYPYNDTTLALQVNGRNDERVGRADFIAVGAVANVRSKAVESMLDDLVARASGWLDELTLLPFDGRTVHKLRRSVEYRLVRLAR